MDVEFQVEESEDDSSVPASVQCDNCQSELSTRTYVYCPGKNQSGTACSYQQCLQCYAASVDIALLQHEVCVLSKCPHCYDNIIYFSDHIRLFSVAEWCVREVFVTAKNPFQLIVLASFDGRTQIMHCSYTAVRNFDTFKNVVQQFLYERLRVGFVYDKALVNFFHDYRRTSLDTLYYGFIQCYFLKFRTDPTLWCDHFKVVWGFWGQCETQSSILGLLLKKHDSYHCVDDLFQETKSVVLTPENLRQLHFTNIFKMLSKKQFYMRNVTNLINSTSLLWQSCVGFHEGFVLWTVTLFSTDLTPVTILLPISELEFKAHVLFTVAEKYRAFWSSTKRAHHQGHAFVEQNFWKKDHLQMGVLGCRKSDYLHNLLDLWELERVWCILIYGPETWERLDIHCPQVKKFAVVEEIKRLSKRSRIY